MRGKGRRLKLRSQRQIEWVPSVTPPGVNPIAVHFGKGAQPIQIALAESQGVPSRAILKELFQDRKGRLPVFVIVAVSHQDAVTLLGPDPDSETLVLKQSTAEAVLNSILDQENEISAYQRAIFLWRSKQTTDMVGFTNNGLFASHFIRTSINRHPKWNEAQKRAAELQHLRDKELITGLGFEISASPSSTLLLSAKSQEKRVVAILLDRSENFEAKSPRLQASPVEWSLGVAAQQGAPWVIAIKDSQLRLYPAKDGVGVGQKSQAETYFEIDLLTVDEEKVGLLDLIFSAEALAEGGTAEGLLSDSKKFAAELGVRLRERVYEDVVPSLATEIANQLRTKGHELDSKGLQLSYELTLRVLFRLLFQAYAEDRGLLPAGRNEIFDSNSMKHWAQHLLNRDPSIPFGDSSTIWFDLMQVWDAIDQGNPEMQIPAYNGGLFGSDPDLHPKGSLIRTLSIPDRVMGPALRALVVDDLTEDGVPGAVDFRSLSVREFGTIYEGLLESSLSVADQDLTVDSKGAWVPAKEKDQILAKENEVYFHSASGERKATGSYYTPSFIVDHLIERSVEPALNDHLAKVKELIDAGDQAAAYKLFFDFRVADLAMGSAHFLVAAIDKIESIMRSFLVQPGNNIEGVNAELIRLEEAAKNALGKDEAAYAEIERASLLRRQIARRCIYGLDINPLAVELSRLAIWIHTFVPGLPMSSLEHNLVCANSLTGIGSVDEGLNALIPERAKGQSTLFDGIVEQSLLEAKALLEEVASADEADKQQALKAAEVAKQARGAASKSKMIFDLAVANRNGIISSGAALFEADLLDLYSNEKVLELVAALQPAHMPYLFPEVFLRERPGFDALVGNPPWDKIEADISNFLTRLRPGFNSLGQEKREKLTKDFLSGDSRQLEEWREEKKRYDLIRLAVVTAGDEGVGSDHPDLAKAFAWRYLRLLSIDGSAGVVLPKTLLSGKAMEFWRREILDGSVKAEFLLATNSGGWVFENVHPQKEFVFCTISGSASEKYSKVAGPYSSKSQWSSRNSDQLVELSKADLGENLEFPSAPTSAAWRVLKKLKTSPPFSQSPLFCKSFYESDATKHKPYFDFSFDGEIKVYKGASFNLFTPFTGELYAATSRESALLISRQKLKAIQATSSEAREFWNEETLPFNFRRIAYRWTTNSTNTRTLICSMVPPEVLLTNGCPYLLPHPEDRLNWAVLGVLSSRIFDWYCRRYVEGTMRQGILNSAAFPELSPDQVDSISHISKALEGNVSDMERGDLLATLDYLVATSFNLDFSDTKVIMESFHKTWRPEEHLIKISRLYEEGRN